MPFSKFRRVVILCPTALSGGPEAIHQLALAITAIGVHCDIAYYGRGHQVIMADGQIRCEPPRSEPLMAHYSGYQPQVSATIPLDPTTLVILPEPLALRHGSFPGCGVAIWWLSVDNALSSVPALQDPATLQPLLQDPKLFHLYQSVYARDFLRANGCVRIVDVGDYTNDFFTRGARSTWSPTPACSYNARKGSDLSAAFFERHPELDGLALKGFNKTQLREIFEQRMIYVDFGNLPGKDRLPREAVVCGSIVFVRRAGAGAFYDDFPIDDFFKFEDADVSSGELAARLKAVMADPAPHWERQAAFRSAVLWEKAVFQDQVMRHWGIRRLV